jgi:hypothetical protein
MEIQTQLVPHAEATRHVEFKLPESRAIELAKTIDECIDWFSTAVADELRALHNALHPSAH